MEEIAVIRKLIGGGATRSYFVTIANKQIEGWKHALATLVPIPWSPRRALSFIKTIGKSETRGSRKIIIPTSITRFLKLGKGDIIWLRLQKLDDTGEVGEPKPVKYPYLATYRTLHSDYHSYFITFSNTYYKILKASVPEPSDKVYVSALIHGEQIRILAEPVIHASTGMVKLIIPSSELLAFEGEKIGGSLIYTVIAVPPRNQALDWITKKPDFLPL